ncbi:MAG: threonine synthase [SAR202 cluster bacterium]|jgi:threonine synthase|nr:MAG: threonine synthase [SAR202 cluster bacterium]MCH2527453.1 threonine synthase [Dehalococcoidia bacterium]MQG81241.1 threonine synthase [SAR202 cluster bacterium]
MFSYIDHLECTQCGKTYPHDELSKISPCCNKVLFARYNLAQLKADKTREDWIDRPSNMWRFAELMPVVNPDNILTLGEGGTPLLEANQLGSKLGMSKLLIKEEGLNPTGTFKARGISAAVSKAYELGVTGFTMPSAGNAAGAAAAYGARAGLPVKVFMPQDAPPANKKESFMAGSELNLVDGLISDAGRIAVTVAEEQNLFDLSTLKEPYRAEGKKTMGLEIAMQLGWKMPDTIIYPTGGGTGIIGMYKGFQELLELGWVSGTPPKFIAVQASGCQPIVKAFNEGKDSAEPWPNATTIADGLRVPGPFADYLILQAIRETGGTALAVEDADMVDAMYELATEEGIIACPEGAATLVGLKELLETGFISRDETVVLLNTGSGYKYLDLIKESK